MKNKRKVIFVFVASFIVLLLLFSVKSKAAKIDVSLSEDKTTHITTVNITSEKKMNKVKIYRKGSNGKYILFYIAAPESTSLKYKIDKIFLSPEKETEIKVVVEDEDGMTAADEKVSKLPEVVPINPSETAKPSYSPTPVPTKTSPSPSPSSTTSASPSSKTSTTPSTSPSPSPSEKTKEEKVNELRQKLVKIAQEELKHPDSKKYNAYFNQSYAPGGWCSEFASWCAYKCGLVDKGIFPKFDGADTGASWFKKKGRLKNRNYTPKPGDVCFTGGSSATHTCIVVSVDKSKGIFYTIDGGSKVSKNKRSLNSSSIYGFGVPDYEKIVK